MAAETDLIGEWCFATAKGGKFTLVPDGDDSVVFIAKNKVPQQMSSTNDGYWEGNSLRVRLSGKQLTLQQRKGEAWGPELSACRSTSSAAGQFVASNVARLSRSLSQTLAASKGLLSSDSEPEPVSPSEPSSARQSLTETAPKPRKSQSMSTDAAEPPPKPKATPSNSLPTASPAVSGTVSKVDSGSAAPGALSLYRPPEPQQTIIARSTGGAYAAPTMTNGTKRPAAEPQVHARSQPSSSYQAPSSASREVQLWTPLPGPAPLRRPLLQQKARSPLEEIAAVSIAAQVEELALACVVAGAHGSFSNDGLELLRKIWTHLSEEATLTDLATCLNGVYADKRQKFVDRQPWPMRLLAMCLCWDVVVDPEDVRYILNDWQPPSLADLCSGLGCSRSSSSTKLPDEIAGEASKPRTIASYCGGLLGYFLLPSASHGSQCLRAACEELTHRMHEHQQADSCCAKVGSWSCWQLGTVLILYAAALVTMFAPVAAQVYSLIMAGVVVKEIWTPGRKLLLDVILLAMSIFLAGFLSDYQVVILPRVAMCGAKLRVGADLKPEAASSRGLDDGLMYAEDHNGHRILVDDV